MSSFNIIDSHIHFYGNDFYSNSYFINSLKFSNIKIISVSTNNQSSIDNINLAKKYDFMIPFIGIHPQFYHENIENFELILSKNKKQFYGFGEIGLDRSYCDTLSKYTDQKQLFRRMLEYAEKQCLPVSIHSRNSLSDVLEIVKEYDIKNVLFHWFDGDVNQIKQIIDNNYYVSFGPVLLYSKRIIKTIDHIPLDLILVETDGPLNYSNCFKSVLSSPFLLPSIIFRLSYIKHKSFHIVCEKIFSNTIKYVNHSF